MPRLYINLSPILKLVGTKEVVKMIETLPGGEPIVIEKVPTLIYCGGCMTEMKCAYGNSFTCPICGKDYQKEMTI